MWKSRRQVLSFVLAGTLITSSLLPPASVAAAEVQDNSIVNTEEQAANSSETQLPLTDGGGVKLDSDITPVSEEGKVVAFDFNEVNSTIVKDTSGNGRDGVLRNYDEGGTSIVDANIYGRDVRALSLPGGMEGGYLELQTGPLNGLESATISCWVNLSTNTGYQRIWDFGTGTTSYAYLLSDGANEGAEGYAAAITTSGWSNEQVANKPEGIEKNKWVLTTVVFDGSNHTLSLYENGKKVKEKTDLTLGVADLSDTDKNYIGWSQYDNNEKTKGLFADFAIYNYPMNEEQVASLYQVSDESIVSSDLAAIDLGDLTQVSSDLTLPATGANGTAFRWESTSSDVIDPATGKVTRPAAGSQDAKVTLTVYGTYGTVVDSKREFEVTVLAMPNSENIVKHDLEALDLGDLSAVTANLTLPTQGEWGSQISWETDNAEVVTKEGVITRPEAGVQAVTATLTATVKMEEVSDTKTFTVTVLPKFDIAQIESYDPIAVKTRVGVAPSLPPFVTVHYTDGTAKELKTIWPASIEAEKYAEVGSFTVSGKIVDENMPIEATVNVVEEELPGAEVLANMIDLSKISLDGDSILTQNKQRTVDYLKLLDNNRMLYNFRKTFGQDTKGAEPLGGWDEPKGLLRGHSTGHYLSALALAYASTGDEELKAKLDDMIHELRVLQEMAEGNPEDFTTACNPNNAAQSLWSADPKTWGEGFISAYSPDQFALLEQYTPYNTIWAPYYTLHKIIAGFLDTYQYTGNTEALDAAKDLGIWVYRRLNACTAEQREKMWGMYIAGEYGGFNESMAKLYNITKDARYLEGAKFFDNKVFFDNLSVNVDDIQGRHANQHIPQIVGAMEEYKATGDSYYYNIGKNFWDMVTSRYAYSIGGVGRGENFKKPYNQANDIESDRNCETCAAYNMLKLTKQLYQYEPDNAEYMDYYERTLYNQIIASQNQEVTEHMHNGTTYMLPIGPGVRKGYGGDYDSFTCCHGTGMENHVKYQEAAYFKSDDTLYVNLYIPSTVSWDEKGVSVKQENQFPSEETKLTVTGNGEFKMKLRVPYWATKGFTVTVNGEAVQTDASLSSYMELNRTWKDGDVVEIQMPYDYHLDKTPDKLEDSTVASVMYGPFVMVAKEDKQTWMSLMLAPELSQSIKKEEANILTLKINGMTFVPMYTAYNFAYHTYFKIVTTEEGGDAQNWYEVAIDNKRPKFGSVTADKVNVPEGGSVTLTFKPNEGYKVKNLLINGEPAVVAENNTYTITDVRKHISVEVSFGSSEPIVYDQDKLEAFAFAETSFCSSWETLDAVNDGVVSETSLGTGVKHYGTWGNNSATEEWVSYIWEDPVKIHTAEMFFFDNSIGGDGGVQVPTSYKYEYLTSDGNWQEVSNAFGYGLEMDKFNSTYFDTVETTSLRVTMQKKAPGVGIIEWKVKGPKEGEEDLTAEEKLQRVLDGIDLGNLENITKNLVLPTLGQYGASIEWKSSDTSVISEKGKVRRPEGEAPAAVTLTATATLDGVTSVRTFEVTVKNCLPKLKITKVDSVEVVTSIGMAPSFPATVRAVFEDESTQMVKVKWPTNLDKALYEKLGGFYVQGSVVGYEEIAVKAAVTVVAESIPTPEIAASGFGLDEISLDGDDTVFAQNMSYNLDYLATVDINKMLYNFYVNYGMEPPSDAKTGGWDGPNARLRGHYTGHFLSALALAYASTQDEVYLERINTMVSKLREFQLMAKGDPAAFETKCGLIYEEEAWKADYEKNSSKDPAEWGAGYLGAYSPDQFAVLEKMDYGANPPSWAPYYTMHKLLAGFVDCYTYTGNEDALAAAKGLGDWCYNRLKGLSQERLTKMWSFWCSGENGSMNDSLIQLYNITKEEKYLDTAKLFDNTIFFDNLSKNVDDIKGRHANQHIPQVTGAVYEYQATGDPYYYNIAKNFFDMVTTRYTYSTGGAGSFESYPSQPYQQANNIVYSGQNASGNCETCATYNMLKLSKELSKVEPDNAAYMDYYERTLVNQMASSSGRDDSYKEKGYLSVTYMLPLSPGEVRSYDAYGGYSCCHGSGMESHVKYQEAAYNKADDTLYVNLYMPTTVNWAEKNLTVKQETTFPSEDSVLTVSGTGTANIKLRVPYWATEGFEVKVNGETVCTNPTASTYFEVKDIKDKDKIEIHMPYTLHLDKTPDRLGGSEVASVMYGPLVMAAKDNSTDWLTLSLESNLNKSIEVSSYNTGEDGNRTSPLLKTNGLEFIPLYDAVNCQYHAYVKIDGQAPAFVADPDKLEASATADTSFCSAWETLNALNDGIVSETSAGKNVSRYGTWGNDSASEWVSYSWEEPVEITQTELFFFDDGEGTHVPASYKYEYLDENGSWVEVANAKGYGTEKDTFNVTTFDSIKTTSLRVTMVKQEAGKEGVGIIEWRVKSTKNDPQTKEYTVTFLDMDGNVIDIQNVKEGESAKAPNAPKVEGYEFVGWEGEYTNVTKDLTIRAIYQQIKDQPQPQPQAKEYTVTFLDKDGKVISTQKVKEGKSVTAPNAPKVEGYEFTGWSKDFTNVKGNITVQAIYKKIVVEQPTDTGKWVQNGSGWWYDNGDGTWSANSWKMINGTWYYFDANGYMKTDWLEINGTWYYLNSNGAMATGWLNDGETWYYLGNSGALATGWADVNDTWYYLGHNGVMQTGWQNVNGSWYFMQDNGAMVTDWLHDGETWYYLNSNGSMATGWVEAGGSWYYMQANGAMATGWQNIGGVWYYLYDNGAMVTDWLNDGGTWYYLKGNGAMAFGWIEVAGAWYYMTGNGAMASSTWIGNYYVNASGAWTRTR